MSRLDLRQLQEWVKSIHFVQPRPPAILPFWSCLHSFPVLQHAPPPAPSPAQVSGTLVSLTCTYVCSAQNQLLPHSVLLSFSLSVASDPCDPMNCRTIGFPALHHLLDFAQTHVLESVMSSNHLIFCYPLPILPSIFPNIGIFSNKSVLRIRWPNYRSFSLSISPSNIYSELICVSSQSVLCFYRDHS